MAGTYRAFFCRPRKLYRSLFLGACCWIGASSLLSAADTRDNLRSVILVQATSGPEVGHSAVRSLLNGEVKIALYVPLTKAYSNAEKRQVLRELEDSIAKLKPSTITSLDLKYREYEIDAGEGPKIQNLNLLVDAEPQCKTLRLVMRGAHMEDAPVFVIRDTSPVSELWSYSFTKCMKSTTQIQRFTVRNRTELQTALIGLQSKPKGFVINATYSLYDYEARADMSVNHIHDLYRKANFKHVDISLFASHSNLALAIPASEPDQPAGLYVNVPRLGDLGASLIYKNLFPYVQRTLTSEAALDR